jgi:hypothetical protein
MKQNDLTTFIIISVVITILGSTATYFLHRHLDKRLGPVNPQ